MVSEVSWEFSGRGMGWNVLTRSPMNSVASVVSASAGRAMPHVKASFDHVLKEMPDSGSS